MKKAFDFKSSFRSIFLTLQFLWQTDKKRAIATFVVEFATSLSPVGYAYIAKLILDSIVSVIQSKTSPKDALPHLLFLIGALAAIDVIDSVLDNISSYLDQTLRENLLNNVNYRLMEVANKLKISNFEDPAFYDRYAKVSRYSASRPPQILKSIVRIFGRVIIVISFLVVLRSDPLLLIPVILSTVPIFVYDSFFAKKFYFITDGRVPESRKVSYLSSQLFSEYNVKELRIFGLHSYFYKLYKEISERFFKQNREIFSSQSKKRSVIQVGSEAFWIFAYYYSAQKALFGLISIGTFNLYLSAFSRIINSMQMIFSDLATLYENNLYLEDLFVLLNMPEDSFEQSGKKKIDEKIVEIRVENLSFSYPGSSKLVLKNINMVIKPGESIALVGRNGAGKTTFVKLLCGLYTPIKGRILINGIPLNDLNLDSYRKLISIVFQDFSYYHFTARENIGFGDLANLNNESKIIAAAKKAGAHDFIIGLTKGYDQQIGKQFEKGVNLSVGQFQKLALARAFMKDSSIMILDEPTASSDTEAELKLFSHIEKFADKKSLILISHRFSTVKIAQKIYVIEKGEIVEEGDHHELMDKKGIYARLYTMQAESYKD